jgi:hypothetical protein
MLSNTMIVLATALALGGTMPATTAFARGGGGGGHGGGGHMGGGMGGGAHMGGGFGSSGFGRGGFSGGYFGGGHFNGRHARFGRGLGGFGFWPYDDYGYSYPDENCYQKQQYQTRTGWHTRQVYVCN